MVKTPTQVRLVALYVAVLILISIILSGCSADTKDTTIVSNTVETIIMGSTTTTYVYDPGSECLLNITSIDSNTGITIKTDYFWSIDDGHLVMSGSYTTVIDATGNIIPDEYIGGTCGI